MKNLLLSFCIILFSCGPALPPQTTPKPVQYDTVWKVIRAVKEKTVTHTDYSYKYDWVNDKFRQQPEVKSETKYFIIFTDGTSEETTMEKSVIYSPGDSVQKVIPKTK